VVEVHLKSRSAGGLAVLGIWLARDTKMGQKMLSFFSMLGFGLSHANFKLMYSEVVFSIRSSLGLSQIQ
jgi:hypothetical protein